jgi:hypothetical protein
MNQKLARIILHVDSVRYYGQEMVKTQKNYLHPTIIYVHKRMHINIYEVIVFLVIVLFQSTL